MNKRTLKCEKLKTKIFILLVVCSLCMLSPSIGYAAIILGLDLTFDTAAIVFEDVPGGGWARD